MRISNILEGPKDIICKCVDRDALCELIELLGERNK